MWLSEATAREAARGNADVLHHLRLDGDPPFACAAHPDGCPPLDTPDGSTWELFPGRYVSDRVSVMLALHAASKRAPPLAGGTLTWPRPLLEAFALLDSLRGDAHG